MKAVILVGGYGTRFRPLTNEVPKPLIPFLGRPMVEWQIEALVEAGVEEIVLAIGYKKELMEDFVAAMQQKYNVRLRCSVEEQPLNTAGPLKLAQKLLMRGKAPAPVKTAESFFFVLNSDIICDYPFAELARFHRVHGGLATLLVKEVADPSRYGIVVRDDRSGLVERFVEKPRAFVGNEINAGIYVFEERMLDLIELRNMSLEREVFPQLAQQRSFYALPLRGFWRDIGLPLDFIECTQLYLQHLHRRGRSSVDEFQLVEDAEGLVGLNLVHPAAELRSQSIGPFCVIHSGVRVGAGAIVGSSVLMNDVEVGEDCEIEHAIVQNNTRIGRGSSLKEVCTLATATVIPEGVALKCARLDSASAL